MIHVEGLGKQYRIGRREVAPYTTLRESLTDAVRAPLRFLKSGRKSCATQSDSESFWALRDVSFDVMPGEVVGIVGRNGAGKSTLLKVLSRITEPTRGCVELWGRLGSLLEVGTGFHPELTGRENIYLNGAILGMSGSEIKDKLDAIIAFAEIAKFVDTPVKRYSSGMYLRLAFALAAHLEPEIMVVDEVLAVGDSSFQKRCLGKMREMKQDGRTVIFVSHNLTMIDQLCSRCILLDEGKIIDEGTTSTVVSTYNRLVASSQCGPFRLSKHPGRTPNSICCMRELVFKTDADVNTNSVEMNDRLKIDVTFRFPRLLDDVTFGIQFKNESQVSVFGVNNLFLPFEQPERPLLEGRISCQIDQLPLMPGIYYLDLYLGTRGTNFDIIHDAAVFEVLPANVFGTGKLPPPSTGSIFCPAIWNLQDETDEPGRGE